MFRYQRVKILVLWSGGAFDHTPYLQAVKGTRAAFIGKLLIWDHNALTKLILNPFLTKSLVFLFSATAAALAPLVYGMSKGLWQSTHEAALWAISFVLTLGLAFLLPPWLLPPTFSPFALAWWKTTSLLGTAVLLFLLGLVRVAGRTMNARDILRQPNAYDLMDLSGAARLGELKRAGLLVRAGEWPAPDSHRLAGRLCIGRFYYDGRPTPYFVAPEIAKL